MVDRYKPVFFAIIGLTIVWFVIILLCLPQQQDDKLLLDGGQHQSPLGAGHFWSSPLKSSQQPLYHPSSFRHSQSAPSPSIVTNNYSNLESNSEDERQPYPSKIAKHLRYFQTKSARPSKLDVIFHQLNTTASGQNLDEPISKEQHKKDTLEFKSVEDPTDRYVKLMGDKLFSFNLLVSNRIGFLRPLPDTRHSKCRKVPSTTSAAATESAIKTTTTTSTESSSISNANHKASIIICYYNEAPSALLRTIYTILKRTDGQCMEEIIVVDDSSEPEYDLTRVEPFLRDLHDPSLVVLKRTKRREGLIRARLFGAEFAKGQILLFLDSHVEPNINWIEPLVSMVRANKTTIACPIIDLINAETMIYTSSPLVKGGMDWALRFKWDSVPTDKLRTYDDFVKPIESPTMAGGLFAIDRDFFYSIGSYDPGMELWGGENIELSLRTWMCGGKIVILPCSRVGHIFRKQRPYGPKQGEPDTLLLNSHRAARVWLDGGSSEYIEKFYEANPSAKYLVSGDVSKRLDLKHQLACKNFSWYLDNVYPDLLERSGTRKQTAATSFSKRMANQQQQLRNSRPQRQVQATSPPFLTGNGRQSSMMFDSGTQVAGHGGGALPKMINQFQIQSTGSDLCIESKRLHTGAGYGRLVLAQCIKIERNTEGEILLTSSTSNSSVFDQIWTETEWHDLRMGPNRCLDVFKNLPLLRKCHTMGSFQDWSHTSGNSSSFMRATISSNQTKTTTTTTKTTTTRDTTTNIFNTRAGLCLGVERVQIDEPIIVTICDKETYERHNYTKQAAASESNYQSWRWRQTTLGSSSRNAAVREGQSTSDWMRRRRRQQTKPSQSWTLLLINSNVRGSNGNTTVPTQVGDRSL